MYEAFFGLNERPFDLTSNPRYLLLTPAHEEALSALQYGLASRCARVRACEIPVLSLDDPTSNAAAQISAEIELARREDHAEVVVLGCAGMAELAARLSESHELPVIDGVASAVKLAEAFGALGLKTSKIGAYARPRPKPYLGSLHRSNPIRPFLIGARRHIQIRLDLPRLSISPAPLVPTIFPLSATTCPRATVMIGQPVTSKPSHGV